MPATLHDRLVASLRALGAADEPRATTKRYTVLRLDRKLARVPDSVPPELEMVPTERARFWFVGSVGALRYAWEKPVVARALAVNETTRAWLLARAPERVPRLEKPGDDRRARVRLQRFL